MPIVKVYKPIGYTPLDMIKILKKEEKHKNTKFSYAGRLDPMAHGIMLYLTGEDCLKQSFFNNLKKIYRFKLLLGVETDTHDVLGLIINQKNTPKKTVIDSIPSLKGISTQPYPLFSSKRYKGRPLWYYGKNNQEHKIEKYPSKDIEIFGIKLMNTEEIDRSELMIDITKRINSINSSKDFRQKEIQEKWNTLDGDRFNILEIEADVSCGTYIRGISSFLNNKYNISTLCLDIFRTKIY